MQNCYLSSAQAAAACDFSNTKHADVAHRKHLPKGAASTCSSFTPVPSIPSHAFRPHPPRTTKQKKKKSMVKQQETEFVCVPIQPAHSTRTEEKHRATWKQNASWTLVAGFYAHTWSSEHENQHLCTGSKFHSWTNPSTDANCTETGTQSIIFPSPFTPEGGKERGPHLPVAVIISFCAWSNPLTWGYFQAWRTKQRWHSLPSLCVFLCLPCLVLLGIAKASKVSKYPWYHQAKTFKESK